MAIVLAVVGALISLIGVWLHGKKTGEQVAAGQMNAARAEAEKKLLDIETKAAAGRQALADKATVDLAALGKQAEMQQNANVKPSDVDRVHQRAGDLWNSDDT